jgi:cytidylate kinase
MSLINIALDGPAGSGKSTIGRILSLRLSYDYLDTGLIYRGITWWFIAMGWEEGEDFTEFLPELEIISGCEPGFCRVFINGIEPPLEVLYSRRISDASSKVSIHQEVRDVANKIFRALAEPKGMVIEGRDIGTVVIPNAEVKIFLTASNEELARRRYKDLELLGERVTYESVLADIIERNTRDTTRKIAPLVPASDAICIDSTNMKIQEVVNSILSIIEGKR